MARKRNQIKADPTACVIYARFSSERQRDESIEDQVRVCSDWAVGHGLTVVATYEDRAISGTSDGRPEFLRMIADARSGNFGTVVVYKLDRFARDRFDAAIYRKRLGDCGVELRSAMESIPDGPEGAILESVIDGFNEYYSRNLSQNVLRGMMGNAERCLVNGVRVFGYRTAPDGTYEVDEAEARLVRGMFERAASGSTRKEIVSWLNESGHRNTRGNRWQYNSVRLLLQSEKYRGVYSFNGVRVEGGMPRIVSDELWEAAQTTMREKPRQFAYLLAGKLYDAETGRAYRGTNGTSSNKRTYLYYSVPTGGGHERRFPRDAVEASVVRALGAAFADREFADNVARAAVLAMSGDADSPETRAARARLDEVSRREANIMRAVEMGVVPPGTSRRLDELSEERARLEQRLAAAAEAVPTVEEMSGWVRTRLAQRPAEELLRHAVSRCAIDAEGYMTVEIPWRSSSKASSFGYSEAQKIGEHAGKSMFSEFRFGRPVNDGKELSLSVSGRSMVLRFWAADPSGRRARAS